MVWNTVHESSRSVQIYSFDLQEYNKQMHENSSILDCILDPNQAKYDLKGDTNRDQVR